MGLWRAIAGMAVALAIGSAIVAAEFSHNLAGRLTAYRGRIVVLNAKVRELKRMATSKGHQLETAHKEIASRDRLKNILLAPDLQTFKLAPAQKGGAASGNLALSLKAKGAMLRVGGLATLANGKVYDAWWLLKQGPPAKAAEFRSAIDGSAFVYLDPPPQGSIAVTCEVTMEDSEGGIEPSGPLQLKGRVAH